MIILNNLMDYVKQNDIAKKIYIKEAILDEIFLIDDAL